MDCLLPLAPYSLRPSGTGNVEAQTDHGTPCAEELKDIHNHVIEPRKRPAEAGLSIGYAAHCNQAAFFCFAGCSVAWAGFTLAFCRAAFSAANSLRRRFFSQSANRCRTWRINV